VVTPKLVEETDRFGFVHTMGRIGVASPKNALEMKEHTFGSALFAAGQETWSISVNTFKAVGQIVMGTRSADELGGFLRIGAYAGAFAEQGFGALVYFAALLSVNLGLINLLPIPMLDGGQLAFLGLEAARGRPLSDRSQEYALRAGLTVLLAVMLMATWNDLVQMKIVAYVVNLVS
jgi:regulator of sigma E protease